MADDLLTPEERKAAVESSARTLFASRRELHRHAWAQSSIYDGWENMPDGKTQIVRQTRSGVIIGIDACNPSEPTLAFWTVFHCELANEWDFNNPESALRIANALAAENGGWE